MATADNLLTLCSPRIKERSCKVKIVFFSEMHHLKNLLKCARIHSGFFFFKELHSPQFSMFFNNRVNIRSEYLGVAVVQKELTKKILVPKGCEFTLESGKVLLF